MNLVLHQQGKLRSTALAVAIVGGIFFSPMISGAEPASAPAAVAAQEAVQIRGTVLDSTGEPVIGASVREYDPKVVKPGVLTDIDGNFVIKVPPGSKLVVSYIGYKEEIVPASEGMTVTLQEEAEMLQAVEVVAYGTQKK